MIVCERALALNPGDATAHNVLGALYLKWLAQPKIAESFFRNALAINPHYLDALHNLARAVHDQARLDEARTILEQTSKIFPDDVEAKIMLGVSMLASGEFQEGWQAYRLRGQSKHYSLKNFPFTPWDGQNLAEKSILVFAEQGLGEDIMFSSCLAEITELAKVCVVECDNRLVKLLQRSFPKATVVGTKHQQINETLSQISHCDYQIAMGNLPAFLRNSWDSFPKHNGYLRADGARIAHWRNRLDALGPGLKVGISWRGGTENSRARVRSTPIESWSPVVNMHGLHFINLQYDSTRDELKKFTDLGAKIHHFDEALSDYDETAALVKAMDSVVSVCTAVIHLAGALGQRTIVLVPAIPEWRYLRHGESMPWYPSVKLLRQSELGHWGKVIDQATQELNRACAVK